MNNIQLNIVANAQFQQVYAEVAKLKEAMLSLQKASVGGPFTPQVTASIRQAQSAFDSAVLSTRAFTVEHVAMSSSIEKFGKQLKAGQLSLSNYYKIWRDSAKGVSAELDALATTQARLNRSIAIADPLRPGYAKLVTDINGVVTAQEKAIFYQKALNTALQQGSVKLIDFGKNTQWMGRQLTVGLTMPLAMFGAGVSSAFLQVDKELTRLQKVYGTGLIQPTQAALKQIRSDVQTLGNELAKTLGTSVQETASMAADLAATGLEGSKLLGSTKEAIRLATLGELDHQQAMQATVALQNVYKLSTQGLSDAVNFLNAVENQTSTSLQDLVDAIPRVGPVVQQLGGSFKDTAAMMVAMKEAGVPAAQGANAIKSALASLVNPSNNAQKAFKSFNIDLAGIAQKTGGAPIMMLKMLADQMKNLDRLAQAQLIEKLFGKYQYSRVQALLDNINRTGTQTQTVFNLMGASTIDLAKLADKELKTQTESASGRFKRMVESLKADLLPAGESFLNSFTKIGNALDTVIRAFRGLGRIMGPIAGMFGKIFGGGLAGLILVGPIIMLVGLFANLIGNILRGANAMRMFKQGMESALPTENRFLAGLHGMRNFYEALDKSVIAARNQMDLMPEAITSNATAFNVLRRSIYDLTKQFQALAAAQAEAAGLSLATGAAAAGGRRGGVKNIPFKAPGMATGGWVPGTGNYDTQPAMLTPGEYVVNKYSAKKYAGLLNSINGGGGTLGGPVTEGRFNYGVEVEPGIVSRIASMFGFNVRADNLGRSRDLKSAFGAILGTRFRSINASMTVPRGMESQALAGNYGANAGDYLSSFEAGGSKTSFTSFLNSIKQAGVIGQQEFENLLTGFTTEYTQAVRQLNKINDLNNPIEQIAQRQVQAFNNPRVSSLFNQFSGSATAFPQRVLTYEERIAAGLPIRERTGGGPSGRSGSVKDVVLNDPQLGRIVIPKEEFKTSGAGAGTTKGFAHASSSVVAQRVQEARQQGATEQRAYEEGRAQVAEQGREQNDPYMRTRSKKKRHSAHAQARQDGMDDANDYVKVAEKTFDEKAPAQSRSERYASKYGIASKMASRGGLMGRIGGRLGGGMGTGFGAMAASMALNAVPNKIGGTDVSGIKGVGSNVASMISMAAFIPGVNAFLPEIAIGTALFSGVKLAFQNADKKRKEFEDGVRKTYSNLEKTPDKFIDKIEKQVEWSDSQVTSYKKLSIYGKIYGDTLLDLFNKVSSGEDKNNKYTKTLDQMISRAKDATTAFNALALSIDTAGNKDLIKIKDQISQVFGASKAGLSAINLYAKMSGAGADATGFISQYGVAALGDSKKTIAWINSQIKKAQAELYKAEHPSVPGGQKNADAQKALEKQIKGREVILKQLQAQLKIMEDQARVIDQQNSFYNRQTDLVQQIKKAEMTGNYIQAAQLRAVKGQETAKYAQQQAIDAKKAQVDAEQQRIADMNAQLQQLKDIAAKAEAIANATANLKTIKDQIAALQGLKTFISNQDIIDKSKKDPLNVRLDVNTPAGKNAMVGGDYQGVGGGTVQSYKGASLIEAYKTMMKDKNPGAFKLLYDGRNPTGPSRYRVFQWNGGYYAYEASNVGTIYEWDPNKGLPGKMLSKSGKMLPPGKATGGPVWGAGTWTSDSIPAMLSHGEFVMNSAAVNKYGLGTMYALNNRMFNVPGQSANPAVGSSAGNQTINFYINGSTDPNAVADAVMSKLKTVNAKTNKTNMVIK